MTARIALIHATPLAMAPIADSFAKHWPQAQCQHLLDDRLSQDLARDGHLTPAMTQRFVDLALYTQGAGATGILFTCSAFGPAIEAAARATGLPTLKPNEAMFEQALAHQPSGQVLQVGLVATFEASLPSMSHEFLALAEQRGLPVQLHTQFVAQAMADLAAGDDQAHHRKVAQGVAALPACDVVMLAQFSMSQAQSLSQQHSAAPVLTSPDCAVLALQQRLHHV